MIKICHLWCKFFVTNFLKWVLEYPFLRTNFLGTRLVFASRNSALNFMRIFSITFYKNKWNLVFSKHFQTSSLSPSKNLVFCVSASLDSCRDVISDQKYTQAFPHVRSSIWVKRCKVHQNLHLLIPNLASMFICSHYKNAIGEVLLLLYRRIPSFYMRPPKNCVSK